MAITEKLKQAHKKAKRVILTGALAVAAVAAPLKGQSAETNNLPKDASVAVTVPDYDDQRIQKFKDVVQAGASKEEIAKYVAFPKVIPVTEDGQFDQKGAYAQAEIFWKDNGKLLQEYYENRHSIHYNFYKSVAKKLAKGDQEKEHFLMGFEKIMDMTEKEQWLAGGKMRKGFPISPLHTALIISVMGVALGIGYARKKGIMADLMEKFPSNEELKKIAITAAGIGALAVGNAIFSMPAKDAPKPEDTFVQVQKAVYNAYIDEYIRSSGIPYHPTAKEAAAQPKYSQGLKVVER